MEDLRARTHISGQSQRSSILGVLDRACAYLENTLVFAAGAMITLAMLITFLDVIMRYVFNSPLSWVFDIISMYLLPGCYFLAFSYALRTGNHLKVDYFKDKFPLKFRKIFLFIFGMMAFLIFAYITYTYALESYSAWKDNEIIYGSVNWLVWPSDFIIAISSFAFSFRLILTTAEHSALDRSES